VVRCQDVAHLVRREFEYRYLVIFFGTFIEGEVVLIAGGFVVYEGYLNFTALVLIVTLTRYYRG
jgi:membrane protein DedA with SNARE-associated domain